MAKKKAIQQKIDPKSLGIPNICFSLTDEKDKREKKFVKQRQTVGFDDSETWNLDMTIAGFVLPRLKRFKEVCAVHPGELTEEEWDGILDEMIAGFELISKTVNHSKEEDKQANKAIKLFSKYFFALWW